jgi:glutamate/aspartate transport system substrate-binding protein
MKKHLIALALAAAAVGTASAQANDTLAKIKSKGEITLGVRDSSGALAFTLGDGKYVGFHTEMSENIAADIQKQLGLPKLTVNKQLITSQNRIPLIVNGTVDLECGSTTNNRARQKDVAFAVTTYVEEVRIAVRADSGITSIKDLNGKTIATTTGTTSVQTLRKNERASGLVQGGDGKDHADSFLCSKPAAPTPLSWTVRSSPATFPSPRIRPISRSSAKCCRSSRSPACCARTTRPS